MNTINFLHFGVPLGQAACLTTDFVAKFILGDGGNSRINFQL
ncbi:MAG: hypothetical protein WDN00_15125 [Limisphaerales bacterium]